MFKRGFSIGGISKFSVLIRPFAFNAVPTPCLHNFALMRLIIGGKPLPIVGAAEPIFRRMI